MQRDDKPKLLNRLARIEGQVRGVARMVEDDRYCIDVLTQVQAVRAALARVEGELLKGHLDHCIESAIVSGDHAEQRRKASELIELLDEPAGSRGGHLGVGDTLVAATLSANSALAARRRSSRRINEEAVMATPQATGTFGVFSADADLLSATLARNWWVVAIRGALGVLFGIIAFTFPLATMLAFVVVFAAYALIGGGLAIVSVVRASGEHRPWGLLILEGVAGILAGVAALAWPGLTVTVFVLLVASWALVSGLLMLGASFSLKADHGRWWLEIGGAASIVYGLLLMLAPALGALVLTWWLGAYAVVFGIALLALSFRLQQARKNG